MAHLYGHKQLTRDEYLKAVVDEQLFGAVQDALSEASLNIANQDGQGEFIDTMRNEKALLDLLIEKLTQYGEELTGDIKAEYEKLGRTVER